jgi:hypothetical protein
MSTSVPYPQAMVIQYCNGNADEAELALHALPDYCVDGIEQQLRQQQQQKYSDSNAKNGG